MVRCRPVCFGNRIIFAGNTIALKNEKNLVNITLLKYRIMQTA
jgi:hypothetical protein